MLIEENIVLVVADQMKSEFVRILKKSGFTDERAEICAEIFTVNSLEGVLSHGVNRFPRFIKNIREGYIKPLAVPTLVHSAGSLEQWNGNLGPGPLNAVFATDRAMEIASEKGIGLVGLANTNHWMRAGAYGRQAGRRGFVLICWTNTCQNMPAWGAKDPRLGNNPFVLAVPYGKDAIVLDLAMSQFSYGKLETYRNEGKKLPVPGGFNRKGELTVDPAEILDSWRILPTGFWKGSGLSLLLDILAAILSGGRSTHEIEDCMSEHGISQVFIAIDIRKLQNFPSIQDSIRSTIDYVHGSVPENEKSEIRYPGENIRKIREQSLNEGIPVLKKIWNEILAL